MPELTKEAIMKQLNITVQQLHTISEYPNIMEKLFCAAILKQGSDIAAKTLAGYNKLGDILYEKI